MSVRTIHSAKGLEFDSVVLCPSKGRISFDPCDRCEEIRLWYVGITRARHCLVVGRGQRERAWWSGESYVSSKYPSRQTARELSIGDLDISTFGNEERRWKVWRHNLEAGDVLEYRPSGGGQFYSPKYPHLGLGRLSGNSRESFGPSINGSNWRIVEVGLKWQTDHWLERVRKSWARYPGWHCLPWRLELVD